MKKHLPLIALTLLCIASVFSNNSTIIADTLSYFSTNPNATLVVNGITGSRGVASVSPKGELFISTTNLDSENPAKQIHVVNPTPIADQTPVVLATPQPTPTGTPASTFYYITDLTVANSHASVDTNVQLLCGSTIKTVCPAAHAGGGCVHPFKTAIRCAASDTISCKSVTTGAAITCSVDGYFSAS